MESILFTDQLVSLNFYGKRIGPEGASLLAQELETNTTLAKLSLHGNELGDAGATAIALALTGRFTTTQMAEEDEEFSTTTSLFGITRVTAEVSVPTVLNTTLRRIDLSGNDIGRAGAEALAEALVECRMLQELVLASNGLGAAGAVAIATALRKNSTLVELDLTLNDIGRDGARAMAWAMTNSPCALGRLTIDANDIGPAGAAAMADMLKQNERLHSCWLRHNDIGNDGAASLADAIEGSNTDVTTLGLVTQYDDQGIRAELLRRIERYLLRNMRAAAIVRSAATRAEGFVVVESSDFKDLQVRNGAVAQALSKDDCLAAMGLTNQPSAKQDFF